VVASLLGSVLAFAPGATQPPPRWGNLANSCLSSCVRRYRSVLYDIPWGQSWEKTCAITPGPAGTAVAGKLPTRCVNTGFNIWGEWDVPDTTCNDPNVHWGDIGTLCPNPSDGGVRLYSAILWDIPWGQSWEETCYCTPGPAGTAVAGKLPTRCVNTGFNIWGEWDVSDTTCPVLPCPSGCRASRVACRGALQVNACWCPRNDGSGEWCPKRKEPLPPWWVSGACVGVWECGCTTNPNFGGDDPTDYWSGCKGYGVPQEQANLSPLSSDLKSLTPERTYVVRSGETLSEIAMKLDTTVEALASANGIPNPDLIYAGQPLKF
jgi:LysM domain